MKKLLWLMLILLSAPALLFADARIGLKMISEPAVFTGLEEVPANLPIAFPPYKTPGPEGLDILGDTVTVGTTWYEYQHNGQIGRMIVLDDDGYVHIVWTNGLDQMSTNRHVYYNLIDPAGSQLFPGSGYAVESSVRAGYTNLAVAHDGTAYIAFHQIIVSGGHAHSAVAVDYFPRIGAFSTFELPWFQGQDLEYIWPRISMKQDGQVLVLSRLNGGDGQTWSLGEYNAALFTMSYTPQELTEPSARISNGTGASHVSNRIGAAYSASLNNGFAGTYAWLNNDLHAMVDDDGVNLNFNNWWNVTNFLSPDTTLLPDTLLAEGDTLRALTDNCVFFDMDGVCHIAFTTLGFRQIEDIAWAAPSIIWHWSENTPDEYQVIANAYYWNYPPGAWNVNAQRPSLGQDPATGYLYCMYQLFDSSTVSAGGYASGEIYISVSMDGGASWSIGTNVTNTVSPMNAAPGECLSEAWPSMAEKVNGYCHIVYVLDRDAGSYLQTEGTITFNPIIYHKVSVNLIATTPLVPQIPFHVEHMQPPASARPETVQIPLQFSLEQNSPNPFNAVTVIRFTLETLSDIRIRLFNLCGKEIRTLAQGTYAAGSHTLEFDCGDLASGIYIVQLECFNRTLERKMVLLK